jgi:hypothetical protein
MEAKISMVSRRWIIDAIHFRSRVEFKRSQHQSTEMAMQLIAESAA